MKLSMEAWLCVVGSLLLLACDTSSDRGAREHYRAPDFDILAKGVTKDDTVLLFTALRYRNYDSAIVLANSGATREFQAYEMDIQSRAIAASCDKIECDFFAFEEAWWEDEKQRFQGHIALLSKATNLFVRVPFKWSVREGFAVCATNDWTIHPTTDMRDLRQ